MTEWLREIGVGLWADALLKQDFGVVGDVAALLADKLRQVFVVVVNEMLGQRAFCFIKQHDFMHLPRRVVTRRTDFQQARLIIGIPACPLRQFAKEIVVAGDAPASITGLL